MKNLREWLWRGRKDPSKPASDFFDVHHLKTVSSLIDSRGLPLGKWSMEDAESLTSAPRAILGLLRSQKKLRRLFPGAVERNSEFRKWLSEAGSLTPRAKENVAATFEADLGDAVRQFYLHSPEVQWRYPLGLLPVGQKRFVKWLLGKGRTKHQLSDEEILWFLHETADDLPRHIALTYLINPAWQKRFVRADFDSEALLKWLRAEFPKYRPFRKVNALPLDAEAVRRSAGARISLGDLDDPGSAEQRGSAALPGVNLLSHFCYPSGLQQAGLAAKEALEAAGLQTSCRDVPTGVQTELAPREDWLGLEVFPVSLTNVAPAPHFATRYERAGLAPRPDVRQIAYWAWELDTVPNEWKELAGALDEIWAPTPFVAEAMRSAMPAPVYDMLPGLAIGEVEKVDRAKLGLRQDEFVFLFMFDMCSDFRRKNPLAVVRAFQNAFRADDRAALVLKISRGDSDPSNLQRLKAAATSGRILIVDELVSRAAAYGYIAMSDCVVSLHRSEGLGLLMAEAMLLGKPVIATNYSGNTAFMTQTNSLLVDYVLAEIGEDGAMYKKGNRWAEPSEKQAVEKMRRLYENPAEAAALGARAKREATELLSLQAAGERMRARLEALLAPGLNRGR